MLVLAGRTEELDRVRRALDRARGYRADELRVISLVLIGVQAGEPTNCCGECGPVSYLGINGQRVAVSLERAPADEDVRRALCSRFALITRAVTL